MKCLVCNQDLGKHRRKYCTDTCYNWVYSLKQKERRWKVSPPQPKRPCAYCATVFQPRDHRHKCCDKVCRNLLESKRAKDSRKKYKKQKPKLKLVSDKLHSPPLPLANSGYSGQIKEFKKNGGKVKVFPPQCNGKTPDVNITSLSGWSVETLFGFGYEIELMEELSDVS